MRACVVCIFNVTPYWWHKYGDILIYTNGTIIYIFHFHLMSGSHPSINRKLWVALFAYDLSRSSNLDNSNQFLSALFVYIWRGRRTKQKKKTTGNSGAAEKAKKSIFVVHFYLEENKSNGTMHFSWNIDLVWLIWTFFLSQNVPLKLWLSR